MVIEGKFVAENKLARMRIFYEVLLWRRRLQYE
jgi:hypothetical protein